MPGLPVRLELRLPPIFFWGKPRAGRAPSSSWPLCALRRGARRDYDPGRELADWVGGGVGRPIGAGFKATYGVYGAFHSAQGALSRLVTAATAIEYEVEEHGGYRWQLWEWTGARIREAGGTR
jgi:hypothetical protein